MLSQEKKESFLLKEWKAKHKISTITRLSAAYLSAVWLSYRHGILIWHYFPTRDRRWFIGMYIINTLWFFLVLVFLILIQSSFQNSIHNWYEKCSVCSTRMLYYTLDQVSARNVQLDTFKMVNWEHGNNSQRNSKVYGFILISLWLNITESIKYLECRGVLRIQLSIKIYKNMFCIFLNGDNIFCLLWTIFAPFCLAFAGENIAYLCYSKGSISTIVFAQNKQPFHSLHKPHMPSGIRPCSSECFFFRPLCGVTNKKYWKGVGYW